MTHRGDSPQRVFDARQNRKKNRGEGEGGTEPLDLAPAEKLRELVGDMDIYLLDQVLKNRFPRGGRILDAGAGSGRNLAWFLRSGYDAYALDSNAGAIISIREMASGLAPHLKEDNFRLETVEDNSFPDEHFDAVLLNAVLHFADSEEHWASILAGAWRVLRPFGVLFVRLATRIGFERTIKPLGGARFQLPDGSRLLLVDEATILEATVRFGAEWLEPLKTTNVQNMRCMTTWVLRKLPPEGEGAGLRLHLAEAYKNRRQSTEDSEMRRE